MRVRARGSPGELFDVGQSAQCLEATFGVPFDASPWERETGAINAHGLVQRWRRVVVVSYPRCFFARVILRRRPKIVTISQYAGWQDNQVVTKCYVRSKGVEVEMDLEFRQNEVRVWWMVDHAPACGFCARVRCSASIEAHLARFLSYIEAFCSESALVHS